MPHATRTAPIRKNVPQEPPSTRELRNELVLKAILKGKCTFRSGRPAIRKSPPTRKLPNELVLKGTLKGKYIFRNGHPDPEKPPPIRKMRDRNPRQFWNKAEIPHATRTARMRKNAQPQSPTILEQGRDTACYKDNTDPQKCAKWTKFSAKFSADRR